MIGGFKGYVLLFLVVIKRGNLHEFLTANMGIPYRNSLILQAVANFTEWNGNMEQLCKSSLHCLVSTNYILLDRTCRALRAGFHIAGTCELSLRAMARVIHMQFSAQMVSFRKKGSSMQGSSSSGQLCTVCGDQTLHSEDQLFVFSSVTFHRITDFVLPLGTTHHPVLSCMTRYSSLSSQPLIFNTGL